MENERWLRPSPWRYVLLVHVLTLLIALTFGGLTAACSFLGLIEGVSAGGWPSGLAFLWVFVAVPLSLGYILERRMAWKVDPGGITVLDNSGRRVATLVWSEVAWVRVFPQGWVFAALRSKRAPVQCLVGVSRESAEWLRQFAREQLKHHLAEDRLA